MAALRQMPNHSVELILQARRASHAEGGDPLTSTPAEYAADIDREEKKWSGLVKKLGLKVE